MTYVFLCVLIRPHLNPPHFLYLHRRMAGSHSRLSHLTTLYDFIHLTPPSFCYKLHPKPKIPLKPTKHPHIFTISYYLNSFTLLKRYIPFFSFILPSKAKHFFFITAFVIRPDEVHTPLSFVKLRHLIYYHFLDRLLSPNQHVNPI